MPDEKYTVSTAESSTAELSWPRRFLKSLFGDNEDVSIMLLILLYYVHSMVFLLLSDNEIFINCHNNLIA